MRFTFDDGTATSHAWKLIMAWPSLENAGLKRSGIRDRVVEKTEISSFGARPQFPSCPLDDVYTITQSSDNDPHSVKHLARS